MRISDWSSDVCSSDLVALANARAGGRLARLDARDDLAPVLLQPEAGGDVFRHRLDADAQIAALHRSAAPERVDDGLCLFGRDCKADAAIAAGGRIDGGVEAVDIARQIELRTAGVALVDRRDGLDIAVVSARSEISWRRRHYDWQTHVEGMCGG